MIQLERLRPRTLRALADVLEARHGLDRPLCAGDLTDEGVEKLCDLLSGPTRSSPTIGFWRRYRRSP